MSGLLIIGNGPAAWSCAITGRIRGLEVTVVGLGISSSALYRARSVDNYPGLPEAEGKKLLSLMREQSLQLGAREEKGMVNLIMPGKPHSVLIANNVWTPDAIVLCCGAPRTSSLPGEDKWLGQGVSYCATCDGRFYSGRRIAVLSESAQGIGEAEYLSTITNDIHYYSLKKHDTALLKGKIEICPELPLSLSRENGSMRLEFENGSQSYDGIFIFRDVYPLQTLLSGLALSEDGISVDRGMRTNFPGIFAAGDCTGKPHQAAKAVGEGNMAALSAAEYIAKEYHKEESL